MSALVPSRKCSNALKPPGSPGRYQRGCLSPGLPACYTRNLTIVPARWRILTGLKSIWNCVRKASPATFCGRNTASGYPCGRIATRSSAAATRLGASRRSAPCANSISLVKNVLSTTVGPRWRLSHQKPVSAGRLRSSWRCWGIKLYLRGGHVYTVATGLASQPRQDAGVLRRCPRNPGP